MGRVKDLTQVAGFYLRKAYVRIKHKAGIGLACHKKGPER